MNTGSLSLDDILSRDPLVLEFGCGTRKHDPVAIGVDVIPSPAVDLVADVFEVLEALPTASVSRIHSSHFIEHISDPSRYVRECARVLKPSGLLQTVAPHWSNPYFYSDPTHRSAWGLYSMCYFGTDKLFRRRVPAYEVRRFELTDVRLVFCSVSEFPVRNVIKHLVGGPINSCRWAQEFYEENLSHIFGCYEVQYKLVRTS